MNKTMQNYDINALLQANYDIEADFQAAHDWVDSGKLKVLFITMSMQHFQFAQALREYAGADMALTSITSSAAGLICRWWIELKGLMAGGNNLVLLRAMETVLTKVIERYQNIIRHGNDPAICAIFRCQLNSLIENNRKISRMRHAHWVD